MPFRIERFVENVKRFTKGSAKKKLLQAGEAYRGLTSRGQKTIAIHDMMELLDRDVPKETRQELMESCGRKCISDGTLKKALRLQNQADDFDGLLALLNKANIGGGLLSRQGDVIHAEYRRCYCGAVNKTKTRFSPTYCHCSCGWYRQLFESLLNRPVRVELLGSIIQGNDSCRFKIHIG